MNISCVPLQAEHDHQHHRLFPGDLGCGCRGSADAQDPVGERFIPAELLQRQPVPDSQNEN